MRRVVSLFLVAFATIPIVAAAYTNPGTPRGFVNDFAGMLQPQEKVQLEQKISSFASSTSNEIAVVTIKSLDGDTIENFAVKLFADWKIGKEKKDNGVLLLISRDDRKMRIEVGYGLEGALTDIQSDEIITSDLVPNFKTGNYYAGIDAAVRDIMAATQGEYTSSAQDKKVINALFDYWYFIPLVFVWLASILGRSKSWWAGGVLGGIIGIIIGFIKGFLLSDSCPSAYLFLSVSSLIFLFRSRTTNIKTAAAFRLGGSVEGAVRAADSAAEVSAVLEAEGRAEEAQAETGNIFL